MEYAVPILVGIIASLLAPIVSNVMQAWIQDRSNRNQRRRELVDSWRAGLAEASDDYDERKAIVSSPWYESLRPYLSEDVREEFEFYYPGHVVVVNVPSPPGQTSKVNMRSARNVLADRVDELAREWHVD